jgi:hypothetical protein
MPAALPLVAGALLAAGSVATAVGITLGAAFTIGAVAVSWGAVLAVTGVALMAVSYLAVRKPKIDSAGSQLDLKLDPQAGVPIVYGRTATGGVVVDRLAWGKKNVYLGIVAVLSAGGPVQAIESYKAGDYQIGWNRSPATGVATALIVGGYGSNSKLYKNKLQQRWQNGDAPAFLTPSSATGYPLNAGALSGLAHTITRFEQNTDAFPQGVPPSLWVVQGVKLYDPRKDSTYPGGSGPHRLATPSSWTFSENPYLAALQWTLGRFENGTRVYGIGAKWAEVDVASFVAGANVADANGWKVGGVVTTTDDKFAVLSTILAAGGGLPVARGAQIGVTYNAPKATVTTLTASDVIGEVEISSTTGNRDRQNTIIPKYREESQAWELITGERVSSSVYVNEDGGETRTVEAEFTFCQQAAQAHQLAAYELCNTREFLTFTANVKLRLLSVRVGEAIQVRLPEVAASSVKCLVVGREFDPMTLSVTLSLKSETDAKHPFALGQSQVAPPSPALDTYDPTNPGAPEANAWAITDTQITTADQKVPVLVVTGAADDPNTAAVIIEYRPVGSTTWLNWGEFARTTTRVEINSVTTGTQYEVAISYRTNLNAIGDRLVMTATAGALQFAYDKVLTGTPKSLNDINPSEYNAYTRTTANFNTRNDRIATIPVAPTYVGSGITSRLNNDGSADLTATWDWSGDMDDIDGFRIRVIRVE